MPKQAFLSLFFLLIFARLPGQTLTTEMGRMRFYNTLDSAKSVWITELSRRCYCLLVLTDSTHSIRLNLDIDTDRNSVDTPSYNLDYNILSGNFIKQPSVNQPPDDTLAEVPGIYIRIRDSVVKQDLVLKLLDYGIRHYDELKLNKLAGKVYDRKFIFLILDQKPSIKFKRTMSRCNP